MKIHFMLFLLSGNNSETNSYASMMKTFESNIRPVIGDIIDDPGFHPDFHNGYEVVKVSINYALDECFVSLKPLVIENGKMKLETYINRLKENGWNTVTKETLSKL